MTMAEGLFTSRKEAMGALRILSIFMQNTPNASKEELAASSSILKEIEYALIEEEESPSPSD